MSALPPKADIAERQLDVRFVPIADSSTGSLAMLLAILGVSSRVSKSGLRIARPDPLIESFGFSFCFCEYREILAAL